MFKTTADIYKALLEGKKIKHLDLERGIFVFLQAGNLHKEVGGRIYKTSYDFEDYSKWQEYIELPWYANIPAQGILCWVWDGVIEKEYVAMIKRRDKDLLGGMVFYETDTCFWNNATPLTRKEVEDLSYYAQ